MAPIFLGGATNVHVSFTTVEPPGTGMSILRRVYGAFREGAVVIPAAGEFKFRLGSVHLNASVYTTGLICPRDVNHGELIVRTISVLVFRLSQRMTNRLAD